MPQSTYKLRGKVWLYPGAAAWHFVTLPKRQAAEIQDMFGAAARGWGSLPVVVTVGQTTWRTSIFPDKKSASYLLPIKASVRKAEGIEAGDVVAFTFHLQA